MNCRRAQGMRHHAMPRLRLVAIHCETGMVLAVGERRDQVEDRHVTLDAKHSLRWSEGPEPGVFGYVTL
jgi:hypothetical protein